MGTNPRRHVVLNSDKDILEELDRCYDKSSVTSSENDSDSESDTDLVQDENVKKTSETNSGILQNDGILRANDVETTTNQQDRNSIGRLLCHHAKVSANIIRDFQWH